MTREEALNILHNASVYHPDYLDALDIAMKAIEQEPCEDAISRKEVFETFGELLGIWGRKALMELPPVLPTRKNGKWVANHDESDDSHTIDCSCCNYTLVRVVNRDYTAEQALDCVKEMTKNYCPKCGAKMESEEDGSN